jgi:hypothetical protein
VAGGAVGIYYAVHGTRVGPSIARPFGQTSIAPPPTIATTSTTSTTVVHGAALADLAAFPVASTGRPPAAAALSPRKDKIVAAPWVARSRPVHISIPAIGVSAKLTELGLNKDGSVQVPTSFAIPGWYKYGPAPGQGGSAVILGHVDNYKGPAVFYRLADLREGNLIYIKDRNGKTLHFAVIGMREYLKSNFPDKVVYGPRHYAALQLVTCGGVFDPQTGHYLSNIVVFTTLVKS